MLGSREARETKQLVPLRERGSLPCVPRASDIYRENKRSGIPRGGSMRDGRARRGKMVQGRRGVRSFSALVCSPVRTPRCPRPRVSYRRDVLGCNLVRCLRWSYVEYPRDIREDYSAALLANVERALAGRTRQVWATARASVQRAWPGGAPRAPVSMSTTSSKRRCRLRAASASSLPLLPQRGV